MIWTMGHKVTVECSYIEITIKILINEILNNCWIADNIILQSHPLNWTSILYLSPTWTADIEILKINPSFTNIKCCCIRVKWFHLIPFNWVWSAITGKLSLIDLRYLLVWRENNMNDSKSGRKGLKSDCKLQQQGGKLQAVTFVYRALARAPGQPGLDSDWVNVSDDWRYSASSPAPAAKIQSKKWKC